MAPATIDDAALLMLVTDGQRLKVGSLPDLAREASLAIGGIDERTAPQALNAGADGLAAIRFFLNRSMTGAVQLLRRRQTCV